MLELHERNVGIEKTFLCNFLFENWRSQSKHYHDYHLGDMFLLLTKEVLCSILDMKEKKNFLVYFWLPIGTYHKNLDIWNLFLKSSKFGSLFS
jgi:hypothetical protein